MSELNMNSSNFREEITNTDKLVLVDFLQLGVDHVKCYLPSFLK